MSEKIIEKYLFFFVDLALHDEFYNFILYILLTDANIYQILFSMYTIQSPIKLLLNLYICLLMKRAIKNLNEK